MKRFFLFAAGIMTAGMVFGIGFNSIDAATPVTQTDLQNAGDAEDFRAMDGTMPTSEETHLVAEGEEGTEAEEDAGIVGMFGLNWKLFLAQLVNFGIILFVLWKWVFGPVTKGLADRTEKIESSLQDAEKIAQDRETFDTWKQGEISTVRTEASAIITAAKQDAEALKQSTLEQTKADQAKLITGAQTKLEQEKQAMLESVKGELAELVVNATSAVLKQKLDPKKDAALIDEALKQAGDTKGTIA
jgi:F-type H+-transporting ATPase subunit b